ncbi:hypothetical protein F8388_021148 [Cannabis sativa]|uniref:CCHC-type domain-containing protein n=1 Tax=Cannabis sativa TaxID=3483 RepID=A0A7J6E313_CANSA|nr:hypothetical protein G4B88_021481 [Cannabis sativa]KAF4388318.1 hypothetical protein F8388_021148 [Cannabis sativa]
MEELLAKTNKLHVSNEEEWEVDHSLSTMIAKFNLRGRLCSKVDHSRGFLKNLLGRIWKLRESEWNIKIQEKFTTAMFLTFSFNSEKTQSRILARMPWYLSNGVLILGKMGNSSDSWKNDLTVIPIWGRALGVPIDYLTEKNTTRLASMAGSVITVQNSDVSRMVADGFSRFQVWMSINKLACPGFLLPCTGHKKWVAFKYDDLPFMCFRCGWIGHSQKDCSLDIKEIIGEDGMTAMAYGTWLKLDNRVRDGFQVGKGGNNETVIVQEQNIKGGSRQSLNIYMGNSFEPLLSEEEGHVQRRSEVIEGKESNQGNKEINKLQNTMAQYQQEETGVETNEMAQDGRGKRRLVEDREVVGAVKLQRIASNHMVMSESQNLVDVPIGFSMDIPGLKESLPFAFGSGNNSIPKEQRRKVALIKDSRGHSMMDLLVEFRYKLAKEEFEDVVKVLWAIWENRNRQWTNQQYMHGARLLEWVFSSYPKENHGKETIQPNQEGVGIGYVWRDWLGNIISAGMEYTPVCCTVNIAEAQAVAAALQDRPKSFHQPFEIRSDCKLLVDAISINGSSLGDMQPVVNQIKRHPEFSHCTKFCHVKRVHNVGTHSLAKRSLDKKLTHSFYNSFPDWLAIACKVNLSHSL